MAGTYLQDKPITQNSSADCDDIGVLQGRKKWRGDRQVHVVAGRPAVGLGRARELIQNVEEGGSGGVNLPASGVCD